MQSGTNRSQSDNKSHGIFYKVARFAAILVLTLLIVISVNFLITMLKSFNIGSHVSIAKQNQVVPLALPDVAWYSTRSVVLDQVPGAFSVSQDQIAVYLEHLSRPTQISYHFKNEKLALIIATFSGHSTLDDYNNTRLVLSKHYAQLPPARKTEHFNRYANIIVGKLRVEHCLTEPALMGVMSEQILYSPAK